MILPKTAKQPRKRRSIGYRSRLQVEQVREAVYLRDEYTCLAALEGGCCFGLTIQHAVNRQMGGSAEVDRPELLRTLCWHHNTLVEQDARFRKVCLRNGWALPRRLADDATSIPVRYPDGRDYRLIGTSRALLTVDEAAELRALYGMGE